MSVSRGPIWCLGGAVWDRKLRLLAPLAPGSSNPVAESSAPGGVARNVAHNLRLLGLPVQLLSSWGDDAGGRLLQADCERLGIGVGAVLRCRNQASGSYSAVLQPDGSLLLGLAQLDALEALTPAALRRSATRRHAAPVQLADMNLRADTLAAWLAEPRQGQAVLLAVSEPKMQRLPAPALAEVLDATGAGDALAAGVLAAWRCGVGAGELPRAARFGQQLAARCLRSLHSVAPDLCPDLLKDLLDAP